MTKEATEQSGGSRVHTCTVCQYKETQQTPPLIHKHKLTKVSAVAPTHTDKGRSEYYKCQGCDLLFKDADGKTQINLSDTIISAVGHKYGSYKKNASYHWQECSCGATSKKVSHSYGDWVVTKVATEEAPGSREHSCKTCGYKVSEEIAKLEASCKHESVSIVEEKEATCTEKGYTGDKVCSGCGETVDKGVETESFGHQYDGDVCTICGLENKNQIQSSSNSGNFTYIIVGMLAGVGLSAILLIIFKKRK